MSDFLRMFGEISCENPSIVFREQTTYFYQKRIHTYFSIQIQIVNNDSFYQLKRETFILQN